MGHTALYQCLKAAAFMSRFDPDCQSYAEQNVSLRHQPTRFEASVAEAGGTCRHIHGLEQAAERSGAQSTTADRTQVVLNGRPVVTNVKPRQASNREWGHLCELLFYMSIDLTTWEQCVRDDMKLLGLHPEWAVFRDMWRDLIWGKRLTLA